MTNLFRAKFLQSRFGKSKVKIVHVAKNNCFFSKWKWCYWYTVWFLLNVKRLNIFFWRSIGSLPLTYNIYSIVQTMAMDEKHRRRSIYPRLLTGRHDRGRFLRSRGSAVTTDRRVPSSAGATRRQPTRTSGVVTSRRSERAAECALRRWCTRYTRVVAASSVSGREEKKRKRKKH